MKPDQRSRTLLAVTQSKSKMYEYGLPEAEHIAIHRDPSRLLRLAVGMLGDLAANVGPGEIDSSHTANLAASARFSARYFDAYRRSHLAGVPDVHLGLLAASAYYLSDLPGTSSVLVSEIPYPGIAIGGSGLEVLLTWLLRGNFGEAMDVPEGPYTIPAQAVARTVSRFFAAQSGEDEVAAAAKSLRQMAYEGGTPRELLVADTIRAVAMKRVDTSAIKCLPVFSQLPRDAWNVALAKRSFVRELWPAQRLLGKEGIFSGKSAVVQMPTSAGKSRATELVIRSAFLSGRAQLAVVVAPFRALCHEIRDNLSRAFAAEDVRINELSDVFQADFAVADLVSERGVIVVTPEKLVYVLRHDPELAARIGVLVLDEGHQFDAGVRGVTYELLLTSLKQLVPAGAQKVLISAVISNGGEIGRWLNGDGGVVVSGSHLLPTERSVAFASWQPAMGQLQFVEADNPDNEEYFVPRVIRSLPLQLRGKETKQRTFPTKGDGRSVGLYLALKLVRNGAVAVFCGRKDSVATMSDVVLDAFDRQVAMEPPLAASNADEVARIARLYERHLGGQAPATRAAKIGVLTHYGNTPHGVRLAVEYAMKEGLARFVVCTSTLAQGVNLPIRYLVVTTTRQGGEKIKVRDFHNLIGRAGRSGMHTEGSILFADPSIYDERAAKDSDWQEFKALLQVSNAEPCASTLLSALGPFQSDGARVSLKVDPLMIVDAYVADAQGDGAWIEEAAKALERKWFSREGLRRQLSRRREILASVESFLLAHWPTAEEAKAVEEATALSERTLAYHLASAEQRSQLKKLFGKLAANVAARATDVPKRSAFGRMLYGLADAMAIEAWVASNIDGLRACESADEALAVCWPLLATRVRDEGFRKWTPGTAVEEFARGWVNGRAFSDLLDGAGRAGVRIGTGPRARRPNIDLVVDMGENVLGFDGALLVGGIAEIVGTAYEDVEETVAILQELQKRMRYGLGSPTAVTIYEAGFADRVLATELAALIGEEGDPAESMAALRSKARDAEATVRSYPLYFSQILEREVLRGL
ncbi:DEAD/DEAH box helicase [Anaeromyxobacter terrae]|uniref:DEAD/DEAH box helicase n=1 Tax=Anaeromyxobacter terrae TaxID=2925406 RepID=UPI001F5A81A5|nr:DEAD/DEAH box helicase [Anaeromyxobacter sp. SG22]